jgi:hypothetical protein
MSTRSTIAIQNQDGTVRACYVHWDGYPSGVGADLLKDFDTPEKINARLDKGDGSSLYDGFYGEDDTDAKVFSDDVHYLKQSKWGWIEYQYLFKDGDWYVYEVLRDNDVVILGKVKEVLEKKSA